MSDAIRCLRTQWNPRNVSPQAPWLCSVSLCAAAMCGAMAALRCTPRLPRCQREQGALPVSKLFKPEHRCTISTRTINASQRQAPIRLSHTNHKPEHIKLRHDCFVNPARGHDNPFVRHSLQRLSLDSSPLQPLKLQPPDQGPRCRQSFAPGMPAHVHRTQQWPQRSLGMWRSRTIEERSCLRSVLGAPALDVGVASINDGVTAHVADGVGNVRAGP